MKTASDRSPQRKQGLQATALACAARLQSMQNNYIADSTQAKCISIVRAYLIAELIHRMFREIAA
jgi:hypothetical protein